MDDFMRKSTRADPCKFANSLDFSGIQTNYLILQELLLWLNPELLNWIMDLNQIHHVIAKANQI